MRRFLFLTAALFLLNFSAHGESLGAAQVKPQNFDEQTVAKFYRGKVVRIVVGFPPGGGADVYSRLIARHLGRFIPGNPTLAVANMPGAGSIIAGNYIFNSGARDGSEIGMLNGAVVLEQLFANPSSPIQAFISTWPSSAI